MLHFLHADETPDSLDQDKNFWRSQVVHRKVAADRNFKSLTKEQVDGVEKLLFFTGYPRSGHSIVGSLLDAHPNIILSYAFFLFRGLMIPSGKKKSIEGLLQSKSLLFNTMYERSYHYSLVSSNKSGKGYTLDVPGMWSGRHNGTLKVIGDKSASASTTAFASVSRGKFKKRYDHLARCTGVELVGIHVVRNPFDMIATHTLYEILNYSWKKHKSNSRAVVSKLVLKEVVDYFFQRASAVKAMVPLCNMKVLTVYNEDLIHSPRQQLLRLCRFLDVQCDEDYLKTCEKKLFPEISRTRDRIVWPPDVKAEINNRMKQYSFFQGYTFDDDFYQTT